MTMFMTLEQREREIARLKELVTSRIDEMFELQRRIKDQVMLINANHYTASVRQRMMDLCQNDLRCIYLKHVDIMRSLHQLKEIMEDIRVINEARNDRRTPQEIVGGQAQGNGLVGQGTLRRVSQGNLGEATPANRRGTTSSNLRGATTEMCPSIEEYTGIMARDICRLLIEEYAERMVGENAVTEEEITGYIAQYDLLYPVTDINNIF